MVAMTKMTCLGASSTEHIDADYGDGDCDGDDDGGDCDGDEGHKNII